VAQHFLLSAKARTLSLASVARLSDEEATSLFAQLRWSDNEGKPYCPRCGCTTIYSYSARKLFKCKACQHQFTVTSGTIFSSRKLAIRDILLAIAIFANSAKGHSALQLSRDLDVQYKTAFVLAHKIREAIAAENPNHVASGEVEIDGAYFGGYVKPKNNKEDRVDRRLAKNQNGKRRSVIVIREHKGKVMTFVTKTEDASLDVIRTRVVEGSTIHADEATHWDRLHAHFDMHRINHSQSYSDGDACTNLAESFFSRLRRAEIGTHHHIAGPYLAAYADEMSWRENHRDVSNGQQYQLMTAAAARHVVSVRWCGYWQRRKAA